MTSSRDVFFGKPRNQTEPVVNIHPELMKLLKDTDPALLVNFLSH